MFTVSVVRMDCCDDRVGGKVLKKTWAVIFLVKKISKPTQGKKEYVCSLYCTLFCNLP